MEDRNSEIDLESGKTFGRSHLVTRLQDQGFSRREAVCAVNAILDSMTDELKAGNEVEFPLGKLVPKPHVHREQKGKFLGRERTIYRRRWTVIHQLDESGDKILNPPVLKPKYKPLILPPKPWEQSQENSSRAFRDRKVSTSKTKPAKSVATRPVENIVEDEVKRTSAGLEEQPAVSKKSAEAPETRNIKQALPAVTDKAGLPPAKIILKRRPLILPPLPSHRVGK